MAKTLKNFYFEAEQLARIEALAERLGLPSAEILRRLVDMSLPAAEADPTRLFVVQNEAPAA